MFNNIQRILKPFYQPCTHAYRQLKFIVPSHKTEKWRPQMFCCKVNYMWNHNKRDKSWIIVDKIFRIVIIDMYNTHSILHCFNYNLIHSYEFATNLNPACTLLMRKPSHLGPPERISHKDIHIYMCKVYYVEGWNLPPSPPLIVNKRC